MNTTFVDAAGLRLRVGRTGVGRPLLLITGIGANLDMWAPFERLLTDRELIAFDAPGARLPDARLHVIKGGGHLFLLDEPQSAVGRIRDFLDEPM